MLYYYYYYYSFTNANFIIAFTILLGDDIFVGDIAVARNLWFSLAQSVRSQNMNHFQLAVLIVHLQVQPRAECKKIEYSVRVVDRSS